MLLQALAELGQESRRLHEESDNLRRDADAAKDLQQAAQGSARRLEGSLADAHKVRPHIWPLCAVTTPLCVLSEQCSAPALRCTQLLCAGARHRSAGALDRPGCCSCRPQGECTA